jgi:hypothetical protein
VLESSNGGHISSLLGTGTAPTVTSCGTSPSVTTTSTDNAFEVTQGGSTTTCTITFNTAFSHQPMCVVTDETTAAGLKVAYTGATAITVTGLTASDKFAGICIGK